MAPLEIYINIYIYTLHYITLVKQCHKPAKKKCWPFSLWEKTQSVGISYTDEFLVGIPHESLKKIGISGIHQCGLSYVCCYFINVIPKSDFLSWNRHG